MINRISKKHLAFAAVVPILFVTAAVQVECPVCNGHGTVSSSNNMEYVRMEGLKATLLEVVPEACAMYTLYRYRVTMSFTNDGLEPAVGWVEMTLVDYSVGRPLGKQYAVIDIAGKSSLEVTYVVLFGSGLQDYIQTDVHAEVLTQDIDCPICGGTGQIALNTWPLSEGMKQTFMAEIKQEIPLKPPIWEEANG